MEQETEEMYELRNLTGSDCSQVKKLWRTVFESKFLVPDDILEYSLFEDPDLYPEASFVCLKKGSQELVGLIAVKVSGEKQIYPDTAWISLFCVAEQYQGKGIGTGLYQAAEQMLKSSGVKTVYIGQDYRYLFSGLPVSSVDEEDFFRKLGFDVSEAALYDLTGNVFNNPKMDAFKTDRFETEFYTETLQAEDDRKLYDFLKKEFPGRWELEAAAFLKENGSRSEIIVLKDKKCDLIRGYCMLSVEAGRQGVLGPIGIAENARGKKVGEYILRQSLMQLRKLGTETVHINWTVLLDYYGKFDFTPFRVFKNACKEI